VRTIHADDGDDGHVMDNFIITRFGALRDGLESCVENVLEVCRRAKNRRPLAGG
jgi:hypothetical protein